MDAPIGDDRRRKRWVWGCTGGCLGFLVAVGALIFLAYYVLSRPMPVPAAEALVAPGASALLVVRIEPDDPLPLEIVSRLAAEQEVGEAVAGDDARAAEAARQALALEKQSLEATVVLGYALLRQGQLSEATALLAAAAERNPDDAMLGCMLGRCYAAQGQSDRAADCYRRVLRSDPEHRLARALLAASGAASDGTR